METSEETSSLGYQTLREETLPLALPGELSLRWDHLCVWRERRVPGPFWRGVRHEKVQILDNVSGVIESGSLTAIMGPSGAGKTSLLATISMREKGEMEGSLTLNGVPATQRLLAAVSGFVPQQDLAFESLTVLEHMEFMARMKMDKHTSEAGRRKRIDQLMSQMCITKCYYTKLEALSGGERKRLSLAVQLINDPPLLFCDEPTSGLDSWATASVVGHLRGLAAAGKAVVCSIHQPASGIFDMFHQVVLLAGGKLAFSGPVRDAVRFFGEQGYHCPVGYNEAEFIVSSVSAEDRARAVCGAWRAAEDQRLLRETIALAVPYQHVANGKTANKAVQSSIDASLNEEIKYNHYFSIEKPGKITQFNWLMWRSYITSKRDNKAWLLEFISFMGISLILALPYQNLLRTIDQRDIQNIQGLLYLIVTETIFIFIYCVFNRFTVEIAIFLREVANGVYSPGPYYLSKILLMIPRAIIEPILYTSIIFWIVGLNGGYTGFLMFIIPVICCANCANAYGAWLSATFESIATASLVSVPIDLLGCMFSGNFIKLSSLPLYLSWIKYCSMFFYSAEAVSILQWSSIDVIKCDPRAGMPCIRTGGEVLNMYGFGKTNYGLDLLGMFVIYMLCHIFGFLALWRRSKKQPVY